MTQSWAVDAPVARTNLPTTEDCPEPESAKVTSEMIVFSSSTCLVVPCQAGLAGARFSEGRQRTGEGGDAAAAHLTADLAHGRAARGVMLNVGAAAPAPHRVGTPAAIPGERRLFTGAALAPSVLLLPARRHLCRSLLLSQPTACRQNCLTLLPLRSTIVVSWLSRACLAKKVAFSYLRICARALCALEAHGFRSRACRP